MVFFVVRLLGPGIAQELLQLTQQMPNNPPGTARFVITEDDLRDSGFYDVCLLVCLSLLYIVI